MTDIKFVLPDVATHSPVAAWPGGARLAGEDGVPGANELPDTPPRRQAVLLRELVMLQAKLERSMQAFRHCPATRILCEPERCTRVEPWVVQPDI